MSLRTSTGDAITLEIEGLEQVRADLDSLSDELQTKYAAIMMANVGEAVKWWMQVNILQQGLLRSGDLYRSIFVTVVTNDEGADVYVGPNTTDVPYAMIQNYGGTIPAHWVRPKGRANGGADVLHWQSGSKDYFSKGHIVGSKNPIIIPARPYIEPAYYDHQEEILDIMNQTINEAIGEEMATSGAWTW